MDANWKPAGDPPEMAMAEYGWRLESVPVLGLTKHGGMAVAFACRDLPEEGEEAPKTRWISGCSEGWDITDELAWWTELPTTDGLDGIVVHGTLKNP